MNNIFQAAKNPTLLNGIFSAKFGKTIKFVTEPSQYRLGSGFSHNLAQQPLAQELKPTYKQMHPWLLHTYPEYEISVYHWCNRSQ